MAGRLCENGSGQHHSTHINPPLETSCLLLLIMLGKVSLDFFTLHVKPKNVRVSFMGCFCASVALLDLALLLISCFIFCLEDFALWGLRFTRYHICLFTQLTSLTCGILHYPVYLLAALDHYTTISHTSQLPKRGQKLLYVVAVVVLWISGFFWILKVPAVYEELEIEKSVTPYQCPVSGSLQSYSISCAMVLLLGTALLARWREVVTTLLSARLVSVSSQPALIFPYTSNTTACFKWQLLTRLLVCFLGTWAPLVVLQVLVVFLGVQIPAYVGMNVPWLYFINSFLLAAVCWCRCHEAELAEGTWSSDPFVSWKFCFVPFDNESTEPADEAGAVIVC
ncbi:probable G-protein coupled receptor 160 [Empidonax traillii]|uniref:probable G-protein coupled receptor 160 n=1 Tax=Empidonax traillii TaxID=164674 RepID=UPI000FFD5817|nr:probable G-protein coupled receptor 160 [Empidonax traillii]